MTSPTPNDKSEGMTEELKPCPYHGDPKAMEFSSASRRFAACRKCDQEDQAAETWYRPVEDWNSAFAWKQLEAAENALKAADRMADMLIERAEAEFTETDRLQAHRLVDEYRAARAKASTSQKGE